MSPVQSFHWIRTSGTIDWDDRSSNTQEERKFNDEKTVCISYGSHAAGALRLFRHRHLWALPITPVRCMGDDSSGDAAEVQYNYQLKAGRDDRSL